MLADFTISPGVLGGVKVAARDINQDGTSEIITLSPGTSSSYLVNA